ncbi:glutamate racemase [Corynebacterium poyangense]|uniref:Glutamate racemase n=1 Tax=Corynebacterium poyangense TaxID=2684405 RepID=A0A7H0SSI0_9CORY|nr:glutamate racemase [Corynebacterium poyangense]QNQ91505.1 glutamate racemase [Corynebacterium poyangense]
MNDPNAPIGIFDSGVGGLTVARTIMDQLPGESIIYIGDTAHSPYGPLPLPLVRTYATEIADELVARGCKMIVIACNTASSAFLRDARQRYKVPVVEVILPAVKRAVATTRNGKVGVIGTVGSMTAGAYQDLFAASPGVEVFTQACPRFVEFVERGITTGPEILGIAQEYVAPLKAAGVDTLVLGCTHYPLLSGVIQLAIGDEVTLVSSSEESAKDVVRQLSSMELLASPEAEVTRVFESTGDPLLFASLSRRFLGPTLTQVTQAGYSSVRFHD